MLLTESAAARRFHPLHGSVKTRPVSIPILPSDTVRFTGKPVDKKAGNDGFFKRLFKKIWAFLTAPFRWLKSFWIEKKGTSDTTQSSQPLINAEQKAGSAPGSLPQFPQSDEAPHQPKNSAAPLVTAPPKAAPKETLPASSSQQPTLPSNKPLMPAKPALVINPLEPTGPVHTQQTGYLTTKEVFGNDLRQIHFHQRGGNTCYLLSALDNIFQHPHGEKILDKIRIQKTAQGYRVKFPGQPKAYEVLESELGKLKTSGSGEVNGVNSNHKGIKILECAYSKIPNPTFGEFDESYNALARIFDAHGVINIQNARNPSAGVLERNGRPVSEEGILLPWQSDHRIGPFEFTHAERFDNFKTYIENAKRQDSLDILTAIPFNFRHYYSIRVHESTPETIVLADPFNTNEPLRLPFKEFMAKYNIEGVQLRR